LPLTTVFPPLRYGSADLAEERLSIDRLGV
jgi:hypothetical protein